jgi:glycosyltransferase involved in cell wall biosynthesis
VSPLISILLPTYEPDPAHLREAIESVLGQTESRWQLLVHDDASTVNVASIVEPFLKDSRIRFSRNPKRLGIGGNWNAVLALALSASPYLQFLFQDDTWHPRYLESALQTLERYPEAAFVTVGHAYVLEKEDVKLRGKFTHVTAMRKSMLREGLNNGKAFLRSWIRRSLHPNVIGEPSFVMLRKTAVEEAGAFRTDLQQCLDLEYWLRIVARHDFAVCEEELGTFRVHSKGASAAHYRNFWRRLERPRILMEFFLRRPLQR